MRVKIGKYKNYFGCYQLCELVFWWAKTEDEYGLPEYHEWVSDLANKLSGGEKKDSILQKFFDWIDNKRNRTIKVKIDKWDTWDAYTTMSHVIHPLLVEFRKNLYSAPNTDDADVPDELKSINAPKVEEQFDVDEFHFKRWEYILDQMIWSFEQILDDNSETKFHTGHIDMLFVPIDLDGNEVPKDDAKYFRMDRGPNDTSHFDKEGYDKHQDKVQNGLRLFGKYFKNLWN